MILTFPRHADARVHGISIPRDLAAPSRTGQCNAVVAQSGIGPKTTKENVGPDPHFLKVMIACLLEVVS